MSMKKSKLLIFIILSGLLICQSSLLKAQGGVGINTTGSAPDSSAILDVSSTTKGTLITRMTTSERDAILNPAIGLLIFNTTTNCINMWQGSSWAAMCGDSGGNLIFTMSLNTNTASLDPLNTTSAPITITLTFLSGTTAGVGFNIAGVPAGITYSLTPGGCFPSCSASLTFQGSLFESGSFPLTLTASGGGYTQTASVTLNVEGTVITLGPNGGTVLAANPQGGPYGAVRLLEVPEGVTSMTIEAFGAQGGGNQGGYGARMKGTFSVTPGEILTLIVGQKGVSESSRGGGGGGTFVVNQSNNPLIVAGGGGGSDSGCGNPPGLPGSTSTSGTTYGSASSGGAGTNGGGGGGGQQGSGGGGGGFYGNGGKGEACNYSGIPGGGGNGTNGVDASGGGGCFAPGGFSFTNGSTGGVNISGNINGGFGGGGSAYSWNCGGGGGGGYSGGGGGGYNSVQEPGGGGGSFNAGTDQSNSSGVQSENGQIIFTW